VRVDKNLLPPNKAARENFTIELPGLSPCIYRGLRTLQAFDSRYLLVVRQRIEFLLSPHELAADWQRIGEIRCGFVHDSNHVS
jgi:hypothetical protein